MPSSGISIVVMIEKLAVSDPHRICCALANSLALVAAAVEARSNEDHSQTGDEAGEPEIGGDGFEGHADTGALKRGQSSATFPC